MVIYSSLDGSSFSLSLNGAVRVAVLSTGLLFFLSLATKRACILFEDRCLDHMSPPLTAPFQYQGTVR